MQVGPMQLVLVLFLVLILFGAGKLPQVFEQLGKGIKAFRDGQREDPLDVGGDESPRKLPRRPAADEAEEVEEFAERERNTSSRS